MSDTPAGQRTPAQIEADIERTRAQLSQTVDRIAERVSPKNVAARGAASARAQVVDEHGNLRTVRVAAAAGVVLLLAALRIWRSRR